MDAGHGELYKDQAGRIAALVEAARAARRQKPLLPSSPSLPTAILHRRILVPSVTCVAELCRHTSTRNLGRVIAHQ